MGIYISLTVLTVAIAYFIRTDALQSCSVQTGEAQPYHVCSGGARRTRQACVNRTLAAAVYLLLAAVSALRIAVGNDYWVYRENFKLIAQDRHVSSEIGFNVIVRFIQFFAGYDNYIPIFFVFSVVTVFFLIRALYDQSDCFVLSLLMCLTLGYYFSSLNSIRYYLALFMAMFAMKYVLKGQYVRFVLLILAAAFFHKSVLIVIPVYLLARLTFSGKAMVLTGLFSISLLVCRDFYRQIIFAFYPFYQNSAFDTADISYINIAKGIGVVFLGLLYYRQTVKGSEQFRFYFQLNVFALILYVCGYYIPEISRIGYYMNISCIFLAPHIVTHIPKRRQRLLFTVLLVAGCTAYFALFLHKAYQSDIRLLPYLNWITD